MEDYFKLFSHFHQKSNHHIQKYALFTSLQENGVFITRDVAVLFEKNLHCPACRDEDGGTKTSKTSSGASTSIEITDDPNGDGVSASNGDDVADSVEEQGLDLVTALGRKNNHY